MKQLVLDFRFAHTPAEIHGVLSKGLTFPPWYGANLDALWDCLSDLSCSEDGDEIVLLLPPKASCPPYLHRVLSVVLEAAAVFSLPIACQEYLSCYVQD